MQALPLAVAILIALGVTPPALRALRLAGMTQPNYRGRALPLPLGLVIPGAAVVALIPLALADHFVDASVLRPELGFAATYTLGVALLGLADDLIGGPARGWRGHGAAALRGSPSTGTLKAAGALGLALFVLSGRGRVGGPYLLEAGVLVLATNLFNLLDLRPGRAVKALVLLGAGLTLGAWDARPLWALGLFVGPALVVGGYDLRERAMLGDTGSNVVGALAGLWLVLTLSTLGLTIALVVMAAFTVYGEFRSISAFVERTPGLRHLDSIGRPLNV